MPPLLLTLALSGPAAGGAPPIYAREGQPLRLEAAAPDPRWYLLTPVPGDYQNPLRCPAGEDCAAVIAYTWVELPALRGQASILVSDVPELRTPGTHRIRPTSADLPAEAEAVDLTNAVELVVRRDDTYVGYASELIGVPFVLNPTVGLDGRHQTDARVGADCVALVIYGQRRLGRDIPYVAPAALTRWTQPVTGPVQVGDVLHWGFQTAILAEDRGEPGVVDAPDLVLQTWHSLAEIRPFGELPYRDAPLTVLRWTPTD